MKLLITTLLVLLLTGCAYNTYEELEAEYKLTGDSTKLDRRDAQMESAELFFLIKHACAQSIHHAWYCTKYTGTRVRRENPNKNLSIDETIRKYQRERADGCQCISNARLF